MADRGDTRAEKLLDRYAHNLAIGLANLHQTLAPGTFILHGDVPGGGERLREAIERRVREIVPPHPAIAPQVRLASTDDHATLRGAAGIVLSRVLQMAV